MTSTDQQAKHLRALIRSWKADAASLEFSRCFEDWEQAHALRRCAKEFAKVLRQRPK